MAALEQQDIGAFVDALEAAARGRFVRWDPRLWREIVGGPAAAFADAGGSRPLIESYLRLACEAIGLGYVFPAAAGYENFFTLAWTKLVPRLLPKLPEARQVEVLAQLWNLGENLEASPAWLRRIFHRRCRDLGSLDTLAALVEEVGRAASAADGELGSEPRVSFVDLSEEDRRFLPGALHFVAPQVVCVHDRLRAATVGVWLAAPPLVLGAMGCKEELGGGSNRGSTGLWKYAQKIDRRVTEAEAIVVTKHRAAATLETSQWLLVFAP